jgi:hypothetical protein
MEGIAVARLTLGDRTSFSHVSDMAWWKKRFRTAAQIVKNPLLIISISWATNNIMLSPDSSHAVFLSEAENSGFEDLVSNSENQIIVAQCLSSSEIKRLSTGDDELAPP